MTKGKQPFDVPTAVERLREAVAAYPKAALFELFAEGHTSVFEIHVACILSIRIRIDTVSTHEPFKLNRVYPGSCGK